MDRHAGLKGYCTGLMLPLSRKSVEPMAARVDPLHASARHQSLHHFVAKAEWSDDEMLRRVSQWVVPVSYTHLDVYKRQLQKCIYATFEQVQAVAGGNNNGYERWNGRQSIAHPVPFLRPLGTRKDLSLIHI